MSQPKPVTAHSLLHVDSYGEGEDIVLLHGWGMHGACWQTLVHELKPHYRLHCIDLPGHGLSTYEGECSLADFVNRIEQTLQHLTDKPFYLIGWSLGGLMSQALALSKSEQVKKLILIASSPCFVQRENWPNAMTEMALQGFADDLKQDYKQTLNRFIALQMRGSENMQQGLRELKALLFSRGEPDPQALKIGLSLLQQVDLRDALGALDLPVMLLGGEYDALVPQRALSDTAELLPQAAVHIIKASGHAPFLSHLHALTPLIKAFFEYE